MTKKITVGHGADQPMVFTSAEGNLDWFIDPDEDGCSTNRLIILRGDDYVACFSCFFYVVAE